MRRDGALQARDVERLIRRTLPVSGDLNLPNETGVKAAPKTSAHRGQGHAAPRRPGQLAGFGETAEAPQRQHSERQRPHAMPQALLRAKKAAILQERAPRNHAGQPKLDHEQRPAQKAGAKPRWNKSQKDAGRARRAQNERASAL